MMNLTCNCSGTFLNFQSSEFKNVSEIINRTANLFVSRVPIVPYRAEFGLFELVVFALTIVLIIVLIFAFREQIKQDKIKQEKYLSVGNITDKPVIPWVLSASKTVRFSGDVRFECQAFTKQYLEKAGGECRKEAIDWLQSIIKPAVFIPETARIVSVPMKNFKCGTGPNEFVPVSGMAPDGYLTYQMCGENRIQVTRYVEDDVEYVAGYCVYIPCPYSSSEPYKQVHIDNCYTGVEHERILKSSGAGASSEAPEESDFTLELRCRQTSKLLKINFCETLKKPVMIGLDCGVVKHYEWLINGYQVRECKSCQLEKWDDNPPPYHLLNV